MTECHCIGRMALNRSNPDRKQCLPDIVQLRPVQKIGESEWQDFDPAPLIANYDDTIGAVINECVRRGITCLAPKREQIAAVADEQDGIAALIEDLTYVYVAPAQCSKEDFDPKAESYVDYHKRHHTARRLLNATFRPSSARDKNVSKKLNYTVK